jgi:hypothetical protein
MIPLIKRWSSAYAGDTLVLRHEDGSVISYRERVRPLARASVIVEDLLDRDPAFQDVTAGPPERLITAEGEYATHVVVTGTIGGEPAQRDVGLVFGDDFHSAIVGLTTRPGRFAEMSQLVRALVQLDSHALGVRRRRYLYAPPPGWQGRARGFTTEWSPLDYPRMPVQVKVFPANPSLDRPPAVLEHMLAEDEAHGFRRDGVWGPEPVASAHELMGWAWTIIGRFGDMPRTYRELIVYNDGRYLYPLRLETMREDPSAERSIFLDVARSVHPIPAPRAPAPSDLDGLVSYWVA